MNSLRPNHYICRCEKCKIIYDQRYDGDITNIELVYHCDLKPVSRKVYFLCPDCLQEFRDLVNSFIYKKEVDVND